MRMSLFFFVLLYLVLLTKFISLSHFHDSFLYAVYGFAVTFYVLIRFSIAFFYQPALADEDDDVYEPTITFGIPSKNEGENIRKTILTIANIDYPVNKFSVVAVDDGSTDNTYQEMVAAQKIAAKKGVKVKIIRWEKNKGKRAGMAETIRSGKEEIILFIDSDSFIEKDSIRKLVRYFIEPNVGAVAGHAYVYNANKNILTRMQSTRYYIAFKAYKSAESIFGTVTCCSGCCSAYRRSAVLPILDKWEQQRFLGVRCTYGDDRSLTNALLERGLQTLYAPDVISYTIVPETFKQFMKQQLRWKKSWFRESLLASRFMWRRNILTSIIFYLGFILPLLAPFFVIRAIVWLPLTAHRYPFQYFFGLILMSTLYGVYYYIYTKDKYWTYSILFSAFYTLLLMWQLPWAIITIRDTQWGTR